MGHECDERQSEALGRIYAAVVEFLGEFERTEGFSEGWLELVNAGLSAEEVNERLWARAESRHYAVCLAAEKEGFCLTGLPAYDAVRDFIWDDLARMYVGRPLYAYRIDAPLEGASGVSLWAELGRARDGMRRAFGLTGDGMHRECFKCTGENPCLSHERFIAHSDFG